MNICLDLVHSHEFDQLFFAMKQGLFPYIDAVFGWDDDFQKKRLLNEYQPDWFYWIKQGSVLVGLLCFKPYDHAYHVHFLIVFPEYQAKGVGTAVMDYVHTLAKEEGRKEVTLSSFRSNKNALRFYKKLGYQTIQEDEHFLSLSRTFRRLL